MISLKVTQVGGEVALVLNDQAQELLGVAEGDTVFVNVAEDGSVSLAKQDMSLEARRERGRAFLHRYRKTFEALAK
jgi:hypothetical protein